MYKDLEEAQTTRMDLQTRISNIDAQLAERAAKVAIGRVPDPEYKEYLDWKVKALRAKSGLVQKLRHTKLWMIRRRQEESAARVLKRGGDQTLLQDLYSLTKSLVSAGADISNDEQRLLDDVAQYLSSH